MALLEQVALLQVDPGFWAFWREFLMGMVKPVAATAVVAMAVALSFTQGLGIEGEMVYAVASSFLQLSVIGFVLQFIFTQKNAVLCCILAYPFTVTVAGVTAGQRAKRVPRGEYIACVSILVGTAVTTFLLVALNIFPFTPRYIIPVAGMMVGNAMTVTGVTMKKLRDDVKTQRNLVETALALGAAPGQATLQQVKTSLVIALSPIIDSAKTVGLITLPGTMTGLIMGGASPLEAIQLQIVVMNMRLGASTVSSILSTYLCWPTFFTKAYQLEHKVFADYRSVPHSHRTEAAYPTSCPDTVTALRSRRLFLAAPQLHSTSPEVRHLIRHHLHLDAAFLSCSRPAHLRSPAGDRVRCGGASDGAREGVAGAGGAAGGSRRAGVLARLPGGHAQAAGRHRRGRHGRRAQLLAAPGPRGRDALRHRARLPPALSHRLRPAVHLHPEERALDPPCLPLHGDGRRYHGGAAREAGSPGEVHRLRVHPGRHGHHHVSARRAQRLPLHAPVHHPRRRHDGRERHDRHRRHHEEAPGGRQDAEEPGRDRTCAGCDSTSGDAPAGEEVAGDRSVSGHRQRQDGGAHRSPGRHDRAHHGRRVATGGHTAADRGDEHAHGRLHRQQHPLHLPLLAGVLHQGFPAK